MKKILKLGPKMLIGFFAASISIGLGFVVSFAVFKGSLGQEAWKAMGALCGSWMGGGGNMLAIQAALNVSEDAMAYALVMDSICGTFYVMFLLWAIGFSHKFNAWTKADTRAIDEVGAALEEEARTSTKPLVWQNILILVGAGFLVSAVSQELGVRINQLRAVGFIVALSAPLALLVTANNLSSGIIICGIVFVMLFVACKIKWPFFLCIGGGVGLLAVAPYIGHLLVKLHILKDYQLGRINVWVNPVQYARSGGYQVLQGLYAIGSGGLFGKGLGESLQKLGFVPEAQNDMIFSIICEELGLFGAISVILIFMFMIYRFMVIAGNAPDLMGAMIVIGVMAHIAIQVILNIAVVTNTIPNTGVTLPFISYGGTSVMFLMLEMGMVLSVSNQIKLEQ